MHFSGQLYLHIQIFYSVTKENDQFGNNAEEYWFKLAFYNSMPIMPHTLFRDNQMFES